MSSFPEDIQRGGPIQSVSLRPWWLCSTRIIPAYNRPRPRGGLFSARMPLDRKALRHGAASFDAALEGHGEDDFGFLNPLQPLRHRVEPPTRTAAK